MTPEHVAQICHDANRRYCRTIGDMSQFVWENSPEWQQKSAIEGVLFHFNNPEAGPEASHESWLAAKEADGWTYGPVKDPEKKEHPCFVPYSKLPEEQKIKDYLFCSIVHGLLPFISVEPKGE